MEHMKQWPVILMLFGAVMGNGQQLADFQWKNRLLFLVADSITDKALQQQLETFQEQEPKLQERDLLVFLMDRQQVYSIQGDILPLSFSETYGSLGLSPHFTGAVLVGKDGGVKEKAHFPVAPDTIFDRIDAMPMRRAELKKNH